MNLERDVILDLVPLYRSGEASAATKRLVEEFAQTDPEITQLLSTRLDDAAEGQPTNLAEELEMKSLERTKSLLHLRSIILGVAVFLSLLPLAIRIGPDGAQWLWSGVENIALSIAASAVLTWGLYFYFHRRLRVSGW